MPKLRYHNIALMDKVKTAEEHIWYASATAKNGWFRNVLVHQIESGLYHRILMIISVVWQATIFPKYRKILNGTAQFLCTPDKPLVCNRFFL